MLSLSSKSVWTPTKGAPLRAHTAGSRQNPQRPHIEPAFPTGMGWEVLSLLWRHLAVMSRRTASGPVYCSVRADACSSMCPTASNLYVNGHERFALHVDKGRCSSSGLESASSFSLIISRFFLLLSKFFSRKLTRPSRELAWWQAWSDLAVASPRAWGSGELARCVEQHWQEITTQ